jgi:hypothetical protein
MAHRRYADPQATAVQVSELEPYVRVVKRIVRRNKDRVNWLAVYNRLEDVKKVCEEIESQASSGAPYVKWRRRAANLMIEIIANVAPERIFEIVAAFHVYQVLGSRKFASDASFWALMLHSVRREAGAGRVWRNGAGPKRLATGGHTTVTYRILDARSRDCAAAFLVSTFGAASVAVAKAELKRIEDEKAKANALHGVLAAIE